MAKSIDDILSGFQINWITLRDMNSGEILWHGNEDYSCPKTNHTIKISKKVLNSVAVVREINFSSVEVWENLKLVQTCLYKGITLDECVFEYGPVVANAVHTWQSVIEAAPEIKMMNVDILSGNIVIISKFYNDDVLVTTSKSRLYYI